MALNKLFVNVPEGSFDAAKTASSSVENSKKIYFFADGRIVSNGKEYSIPTASFDDVKNRIKAVEDLIKADGGTIDKVNEVLTWFAGIETTDPVGTALVADVATNKSDIASIKTNVQTNTNNIAANEANITANKSAIDTLNGADTVTGSVANSIKTAISALDVTDVAVEGEYVSSVSEADGVISVTRVALPTLSVKAGSENYAAVNNHEVEIKTSSLSSVGLEKVDGQWTVSTSNVETGLAVAADVAKEIADDEIVIAAALNDHEARMLAAEADIEAIKAEDKVHTTVTDNTGNYVKVSTAADTKVVTVTENVVTLENATSANTGIADAYNVKQYVDAAKTSAQEYVDNYDYWETFTV